MNDAVRLQAECFQALALVIQAYQALLLAAREDAARYSHADKHYHVDLVIAQRLAAADPGNAEYQRDLSISRELLRDLDVQD